MIQRSTVPKIPGWIVNFKNTNWTVKIIIVNLVRLTHSCSPRHAWSAVHGLTQHTCIISAAIKPLSTQALIGMF